jgi:hypothetical protein
MDLTAKIVELLVSWGPGGIMAGVFYMMARQERLDHKEDVEKLERTIAAKDVLLVETLNKSNDAIDKAGERMAGLVEKSATLGNTIQNALTRLDRQ